VATVGNILHSRINDGTLLCTVYCGVNSQVDPTVQSILRSMRGRRLYLLQYTATVGCDIDSTVGENSSNIRKEVYWQYTTK
jgi:hypothetical protein